MATLKLKTHWRLSSVHLDFDNKKTSPLRETEGLNQTNPAV